MIGPQRSRAEYDGLVDDYRRMKFIEERASDARVLGCEAEVRYALTIIREGTGADQQVHLYRPRRLERYT